MYEGPTVAFMPQGLEGPWSGPGITRICRRFVASVNAQFAVHTYRFFVCKISNVSLCGLDIEWVAPSLVTQLNSFLCRKFLGRPPIIVSVFFTVITVCSHNNLCFSWLCSQVSRYTSVAQVMWSFKNTVFAMSRSTYDSNLVIAL